MNHETLLSGEKFAGMLDAWSSATLLGNGPTGASIPDPIKIRASFPTVTPALHCPP
jgi:hypothetical protein